MSTIDEKEFDRLPDGRPVSMYTLKNTSGIVAKVMSFGAILTELHVPDRNGALSNVVLGFDNLEQYLKGHPYFGATTGRVANRIAKGRFTLDGKEYNLAVNNGRNHLHGGLKGFDKVLWESRIERGAIAFHYLSPDGDEQYPGNLDVHVTFALTESNELRIDYAATTDRATLVNLTNHSYFNLAGSGGVLSHELWIDADHYTPSDDELIPSGEIAAVRGTPLDFTMPAPIGARFAGIKSNPRGYDDNFVLNRSGNSLVLIARVGEPRSGRVMEVLTTEPGVQLYTGNFLDGTLTGHGGVTYHQHAGFCLETQHFPDAINHPNFPSIVLRPGGTYRSATVYRFGGA